MTNEKGHTSSIFLYSTMELTYGIFGENRFGWWARVSNSHLVLSTDSELILTAFQQFCDTILNIRVNPLRVAANPSGRRNNSNFVMFL